MKDKVRSPRRTPRSTGSRSNKMTTRDAILNLLRSGPKTSWELTQEAKTSRYGGRIMELRRMGYDIRHSIHSLLRADGEAVVQHVYELVSEPGAIKADSTRRRSAAKLHDGTSQKSAAKGRDGSRTKSAQGKLF